MLRYNHTKRKGYKALTTKQVEEAARFPFYIVRLSNGAYVASYSEFLGSVETAADISGALRFKKELTGAMVAEQFNGDVLQVKERRYCDINTVLYERTDV